MSGLRFDWDDEKAAINVRSHRVSFDEAKTVFGDEHRIAEPDAEHSDKEDRDRVIGFSERGRLLLVVYTERHEEGETTIRLISARRATRKEKERYAGQIHGS